ncbi:hypothetical protein [Microbacterium lacticum]
MRNRTSESLECGLAADTERIADRLPRDPGGTRRDDEVDQPCLRPARQLIGLPDRSDVIDRDANRLCPLDHCCEFGQRNPVILGLIDHLSDHRDSLRARQPIVDMHSS